jgi:hypothetical protein
MADRDERPLMASQLRAMLTDGLKAPMGDNKSAIARSEGLDQSHRLVATQADR